MKDIYIIISIISLFTGVSSLSISYFIYKNNNKLILKYFIAFIASLFAIQNSITLNLYIKYTNEVNSLLIFFSKILDFFGTSFSTLLGLIFVHLIFNIHLTKIKKKLIFYLFSLQLIGIGIYYLFHTPNILKFLLQASIILVIMYEIYICLKNYKKVKNKYLKKTLKLLILITLIFLPFMIAEYCKQYISIISNLDIIKVISFPCFFLCINIVIIFFVMNYFSKSSYTENNKLTDYFKDKYQITDKQSEIIELILEGKTYKQIAEELYISPKTVDNHVQNIYKKLNVKSKIQLSNFIYSNK